MKLLVSCSLIACLLLSACSQNGSDGGSAGGPSGPGGVQTNKGEVSEWQTSLLGQEGHGGDAIVCFDVPVAQALYQLNLKPESTCKPGEICKMPAGPAGSVGAVWRMTEVGRKSIRSAKPLEQYLAERISSKKSIIEQLNQMSVEEGYKKILLPFVELPAPFNRLAEMHKKLGWLAEEGISSEFGLMDIADSGFVQENEIDGTYCKELQAVVRRDNQLWYDKDIVSHFDNAGKVLIQLHEEIYAWGKNQDQINENFRYPPAHQTSTKTRRLILKVLDFDIDHKTLNENLKSSGFSILHWENNFNLPTSAGYFMDKETCLNEQVYLHDAFKDLKALTEEDSWFHVESVFSSRYMKWGGSYSAIDLRHNFPDALSNMIAFAMRDMGSKSNFRKDFVKLQQIFERPESCQGSL